jgi:tetratricopeptide (TPR) repeat protein
MAPQRGMRVAGYVLALLITAVPIGQAHGQSIPDEPALTFSRAESLGLSPAKTAELKQKLESADYAAAEKLLLTEIDQDPHSLHAATLLSFIGGVFYLNHDYFHAAVAWNKSQAIAPLPTALKFSLAMTYIRMDRADWARDVLADLARESPQDAIYPYWLGRLDYDAHIYSDAVAHFKRAIALAPGMARAYDNLGLCYYQQNQNALAVESYQKAIDLDRSTPHPSAWPYLNLAVTLRLLDRPREAEANLREAVRLDPKFAQAHFQLGNVLEQMGESRAAIGEFRAAASSDPGFAEPHFALARIYRKLGDESAAGEEVKIYLRLHNLSATTSSTPQKPLP